MGGGGRQDEPRQRTAAGLYRQDAAGLAGEFFQEAGAQSRLGLRLGKADAVIADAERPSGIALLEPDIDLAGLVIGECVTAFVTNSLVTRPIAIARLRGM